MKSAYYAIVHFYVGIPLKESERSGPARDSVEEAEADLPGLFNEAKKIAYETNHGFPMYGTIQRRYFDKGCI